MNDIQTHLDKIRSDAAECVLLSNLVADGKGEVFARTAKHLSALALEIEKTIATNSASKLVDQRHEPELAARHGFAPRQSRSSRHHFSGSSDEPSPFVNIELHQTFVSHFQQEGL